MSKIIFFFILLSSSLYAYFENNSPKTTAYLDNIWKTFNDEKIIEFGSSMKNGKIPIKQAYMQALKECEQDIVGMCLTICTSTRV